MSKRPPEWYLSLYKTLEDVPTTRRFDRLSPIDFPHEEPWDAFFEAWPMQKSQYTVDKYDRVYREWTAFMEDMNRHYALADPYHVEEWATFMQSTGRRGGSDERDPLTVYRFYIAPLANFYDYLATHTDYRHAYNPVYMAGADGGNTRAVYEAYLNK